MEIRKFIMINGNPVELSELTDEKRREISEKLNVRAAEQIGYKRTA